MSTVNVRGFGVPEDKKALQNILDVLNTRLGINVTTNNIEAHYRVGCVVQNSEPMAVVITFCSYDFKKLVVTNKAKLKSTEIIIKEGLTPARLQTYLLACQKFNYRNVWTNDVIIYIKILNKIVKCTNMQEIADISI